MTAYSKLYANNITALNLPKYTTIEAADVLQLKSLYLLEDKLAIRIYRINPIITFSPIGNINIIKDAVISIYTCISITGPPDYIFTTPLILPSYVTITDNSGGTYSFPDGILNTSIPKTYNVRYTIIDPYGNLTIATKVFIVNI